MPQATESPVRTDRRLVLLASGLIAATTWCWVAARAAGSSRSSLDGLVGQVESMQEDAARIQQLRSARLIATDRERPNDELIAQIRGALEKVEIPADRWIATDPIPAVRLPQTPYKKCGLRLTLQGMSMRELVHFAYVLTEGDSSLSMTDVRLALPPGSKQSHWNVDLTLDYLLYSPQDAAVPPPRQFASPR